jgi:hypothetical protein
VLQHQCYQQQRHLHIDISPLSQIAEIVVLQNKANFKENFGK